MEPKRLNKFISDTGFCSRREADRLIEEGRVTVNNKLPDAGTKVTPKDKVRIDDQMLRVREEVPVFLAFNKPAGISTKTDDSVKNNIIRALNYPASLQPIGQLDRDGEGLIFLSNDTELVRKLVRGDNRLQKEYILKVDKVITPEFLDKISYMGPPEPGEVQRKHTVTKEGPSKFRILLEPNADHHIKSLCETLGYKVVHLQRTRIQNISLAKLANGHWRTLSQPEIDVLIETVSGKSSRKQEADQDEFAEARRRELAARTKTFDKNRSAGKPATSKSKTERVNSKRAASASKSTPRNAAAKPESKRTFTKDAPKGAGRNAAPKPATNRSASSKNTSRKPR